MLKFCTFYVDNLICILALCIQALCLYTDRLIMHWSICESTRAKGVTISPFMSYTKAWRLIAALI